MHSHLLVLFIVRNTKDQSNSTMQIFLPCFNKTEKYFLLWLMYLFHDFFIQTQLKIRLSLFRNIHDSRYLYFRNCATHFSPYDLNQYRTSKIIEIFMPRCCGFSNTNMFSTYPISSRGT